jgi:glucose-6-phosphate dehydrogenase assembly protein OpcA
MNQSSPIVWFGFERRPALGLVGWLAACLVWKRVRFRLEVAWIKSE